MSRWMRRRRGAGQTDKRARVLTIDLPPVHYGMYAVMFGGAYLGFRFLR